MDASIPITINPICHIGLCTESPLSEIAVGKRCRVGGSDTRRGKVAYVGDVSEIPGIGPWIGVELDEPVGKNNGSAGRTAYFECEPNFGIFVRADRVEVGMYAAIGLADDLESDMEEI